MSDHHSDFSHHVQTPRLLIGIFVALLALTGLTVYLAKFDLGTWEVGISLGIASIKAVMVAGWYMHLAHDNKFNLLLLLFTLATVALFVLLTMLDVAPSPEAL